jgi:hypothetical protein
VLFRGNIFVHFLYTYWLLSIIFTNIQGDQKVSVHLMISYILHIFEQSPHNWWFEDGHHRILSECGPCYTEDSLRENFGLSINVWRLAGNTLIITCNFLYCNHQAHKDFFYHPVQSICQTKISLNTTCNLGTNLTVRCVLSITVAIEKKYSGSSSYDRLDIRTTWVTTKISVSTYDQSL